RSRVHLRVPPQRADRGQERLPLRLVRDQRAEQVARIPVQDHSADVEDEHGAGGEPGGIVVGGHQTPSLWLPGGPAGGGADGPRGGLWLIRRCRATGSRWLETRSPSASRRASRSRAKSV